MIFEHLRDTLYLIRRYGFVTGISHTHRGRSPMCRCWFCRRGAL